MFSLCGLHLERDSTCDTGLDLSLLETGLVQTLTCEQNFNKCHHESVLELYADGIMTPKGNDSRALGILPRLF